MVAADTADIAVPDMVAADTADIGDTGNIGLVVDRASVVDNLGSVASFLLFTFILRCVILHEPLLRVS